MCDQEVMEALEALRAADQELEAPPKVEARLLAAYRQRRQRRWWARAYVGMAAAAALVVGVALRPHASAPVMEPAPVSVRPAIAPVVPEGLPAHPTQVQSGRVQIRRATATPREMYTDFYPLIDLAPPLERGEIVRVTVPASTMRRVGMLVMASHLDDPVDADVLIGQDGMARAIRFVTYQ